MSGVNFCLDMLITNFHNKYEYFIQHIIYKLLVAQLSKHFHGIYGTRHSVPCSQEYNIHPYCTSVESNKIIPYLLINAKYPGLDVGIVVMRDVVNCEDRAIFLGVSTLWPERGVILL